MAIGDFEPAHGACTRMRQFQRKPHCSSVRAEGGSAVAKGHTKSDRHGMAHATFVHNVRAYELSSRSLELYLLLQSRSAAKLMRGNYEAAAEWCLKSLRTFSG